jgi:AbrB family looped-hinge helix DNA binding protein
MREFTTTVTERGQVTVPAEVRRLLGIKPRSKLTFRIEGDEVHLLPAAFTLASTFGSVKPINRPEDFEKMIREAKEEHAVRTMRKLKNQ